ncbi:MAG: HTH domain-containing protein [Crocinitomicaceae bacterium]|nr:HTH domain-containing protein [Crocinitomicaceae bacterium]
MNILKIKQFILLVEKQRTGSPKEVAAKLAVSNRMIHNYVHLLKSSSNAPIEYNRYKKSYHFTEEGFLAWEWYKVEKK